MLEANGCVRIRKCMMEQSSSTVSSCLSAIHRGFLDAYLANHTIYAQLLFGIKNWVDAPMVNRAVDNILETMCALNRLSEQESSRASSPAASNRL